MRGLSRRAVVVKPFVCLQYSGKIVGSNSAPTTKQLKLSSVATFKLHNA